MLETMALSSSNELDNEYFPKTVLINYTRTKSK